MDHSDTTLRFAVPCLNPEADRRELGTWGEDVATAFLAARGYDILDRNWRHRYGELDIVALSATGRIVAVEVKTRREGGRVPAEQAIGADKYARLRLLFSQWLAERKPGAADISIDAIAVTVMPDGTVRLRHEEAIS